MQDSECAMHNASYEGSCKEIGSYKYTVYASHLAECREGLRMSLTVLVIGPYCGNVFIVQSDVSTTITIFSHQTTVICHKQYLIHDLLFLPISTMESRVS